ncbi:MAG: PEP-CTERM sorting domain-containing protein [Steroidobacteraceae bacterium]
MRHCTGRSSISIISVALSLTCWAHQARAGIVWLQDNRDIAGDVSLTCSACTPYTNSPTYTVQPFSVGSFYVFGLPGSANGTQSGYGAQLYGEPSASLSGYINTGGTWSSFVSGQSLSIASGTQHGTDVTGSVSVSTESMFDITLQLTSSYDFSLSGQTYLSSDAIQGDAVAALELLSAGSSTPLMLYQTTMPGEFDNWSFNQTLNPGTYQVEGYAYTEDDGTFPPDYYITNNQSTFEMSFAISPASVPDPDTLLLMLAGLASLAVAIRISKQRHRASFNRSF